ncbi:GntR family transcriptional regulator [Phytoactinopolyspora alkaliphila]|uniref:GntR family transcriptional regulator n=2 Tax=Phytoactinopolyspora alkaliphila TaxID=1783498 RepID=A0A6N9YKT3_9ACTN|nr:GntR family transcriptional regulator [Phytoactinopolyspora alkaliphila]
MIDGTLPPGTRLRDQDIAEQLDVSRMPVREAVRRLSDEGLVVAEASRWTKVAPIDFDAASRIYPIIQSLECLALDLSSSSIGPAHIATLKEANAELEQALSGGDPLAASAADDRFHQVILDAAANRELKAIVVDMKMRVHRVEVGYFGGTITSGESCRQHAEMIEALERHDLSTARAALEANWSGSIERAQQRRSHGDGLHTHERNA